MRARIFLKTGICLAAIALLLFSMTGMCMADGLLEDTPLGDALDKLKELGEAVVDVLTPDIPAAPGTDAAGAVEATASSPLPDPGSALDPSNLPGLDTLTGVLDPSNLPGLGSLPGMEGGLPQIPGLPEDPMQVLQIIDGEEQLFVVLDLEKLIEARLGLGKELEEAPLLELQVILFDALAAEGSLGIQKVDDNAFLVPVELYLKYMAGEEGWKEILDVVLPLELSFPGAGMVPDAVQTIIDTLYKYILKPILSLLPIHHEVKPDTPTPDEPTAPSVVPPTEVKGDVVEGTAGGSGDHLPFTGAELTILLVLIVSLAVGGLLLNGLERKMKRKAG